MLEGNENNEAIFGKFNFQKILFYILRSNVDTTQCEDYYLMMILHRYKRLS